MPDRWTRLEPDRSRAILAAARTRRVLILGDVMLDRYLWGEVSRISPEAPVPVVEVSRESVRLGGAANVAHNVFSLGASPVLLGVVGQDAAAELLTAELAKVGVPAEGLVTDAARPTTLKTRIVARGQHVVRADQENREELTDGVEAEVRERALAALHDAAAVVISDYGKGVITRDVLDPVLAAARERGVPVCVDPKDTHFFSYRGVEVLTPNHHEAAEVLGFKLHDETAVARAGEELLQRLQSRGVLITRGDKGMSLFERSGRRTEFPAMAQRVYDVTGAGDTVVGTYAVAAAGGAEAREAALLANHAAGLVVAEIGTAVPDPARLIAAAGEASA